MTADDQSALAQVEVALAQLLAQRYASEELVVQAVRYALASGGKRVRPVLCVLACEALGGERTAALPAALAVEMVHTYSLVHDDLPCMDDDDTRRGQPTTHKKFGEAVALLAGDALLTDAFTILSAPDAAAAWPGGADAQRRLAMVHELATAAGSQGMVLGQDLDLFWTARREPSLAALSRIHLHKTGALLGASAAMGAIASGASPAVVAQLRTFGRHLGMAFQILDDLLDDSQATGKSPGKDKQVGKLTYLSLMSPAAARAEAARFSAEAVAILDACCVPGAGGALRALVHSLLDRSY